jgi:hypothetical protein
MIGIVGKVAEIVDEYTVVINRGHEHGVEEDMRFVIYEPGEEIKDPETSEFLGKFEYVKAKVKVTNVSEKFSTATTCEADTPQVFRGLGGLLGAQCRVLPLDKEMKEKMPNYNTTVNIGDLVRQILD